MATDKRNRNRPSKKQIDIKKNVLINIAKNRIALEASKIQMVHGVKKGEPESGFQLSPYGSSSSGSAIDKEFWRSFFKEKKNVAPINFFLPAVITNPLGDFFKKKNIDWLDRQRNKYDYVGKRGTQIKTQASTVFDVVPYEDYIAGPTITTEQLVRNRRKDYERRQAELSERKENHYNYLRKQAGERRDLYDKAPWAKSLIKSGIIDQKYIPNISKKIDRMVRLPLVGYGLRMAVRNPALGAYMLAATYLNKSASSDQSMTSMKVGQKAFGPIPQQFRIFAAATGMKEEQTQKAWFGLQEKYGPAAMSVLSMASKAMEGKTPLQRQYIAQGFGIDANLVRVADMMTGTRAMDKGERTTLAKHFTEIQKEFGFSSDADAKDLLAALYLTIPGMASARAKDAGASDWVFDEILESNARINEILSGVSASQNAAVSAVGYDSQGSTSNITTNNTGGDITINQVIYTSGNAQEIANKVGDETKEAINRQRVMDAITTGDKQ